MGTGQYGANVEPFFLIVYAYPVEIGNARVLEIPEVNGVVDVPEGVHVPPDDVLVQNDRILLFEWVHAGYSNRGQV
jgi:hypothetical protein